MLIPGCSVIGDWFDFGADKASAADTEILGAPSTETYVHELGLVAGNDSSAGAEVLADASAAVRLTPGPTENLRLGLLLAVPGHAKSDPGRAIALLTEVLDSRELMTQAEISLAQVMLRSAERQITSNAEARQLIDESSREQQDRREQAEQRLAAATAENARLREQLAEAEQKLEALTSIEQSIRDRE